MRRWVGPWVWAVLQIYLIAQAVFVAVDLDTWMEWADPQHTVSPEQLFFVPGNAAFVVLAAGVISAAIAVSRVDVSRVNVANRPRLLRRSLRGKFYAMYLPIDLAAAVMTITTIHRRMIVLDGWNTQVPWATVLFVFVVSGTVAFLVINERSA